MEKDLEDKINEAFAIYLHQCDAGTLTSRKDFLAQFPEIQDQLCELMESADMIGRVSRSSLGSRALKGETSKAERQDSTQNSFVLTGFSTPILPVDQDLDDLPASAQVDSQVVEQGDHSIDHSQEGAFLRERDPSAETVHHRSGDVSLGIDEEVDEEDPAATLPVANRKRGDMGPTLPYELGDYLLLEVIGRGGMGVVYKANQSELQREVAVKMIRSGILASESEVSRFNTEAKAVAKLHHPGIVSVYQFGKRAGHHFFSMEYIDGMDLQHKINSSQLPIIDAVRYVRDVARAIEHAHEKGVLHRDLKPANVLIDKQDQVHVTDFGLAKRLDHDGGITSSGDAIGTPHYMAPEQATGQNDQVGQGSDVYSLGAVLFACIAGHPPLVGDTIMQTMTKVVHELPPSLRSIRPETPVDLQTVVEKCLEKAPQDRYQTAGHLADELNAILDGRPIDARPRSLPMRMWHWIEGIPVVGAVRGHRVLHGSLSHRRLQAALLMLFVLTPIVSVALLSYLREHHEDMPSQVRMAGGIPEGVYQQVSIELASRIREHHLVEFSVNPSRGSDDNFEQLVRGTIDLAPMQATCIRGDQLRVVAPLFYERLYLVARENSSITSVQDFVGKRIATGPPGSGSVSIASLVLNSLGFDRSNIEELHEPWDRLLTTPSADAAMICLGRGSELIEKLLADGQWILVPLPKSIEIALQHPTLRPMTITEFGGDPIPTVGTTAFLSARVDTPSQLVLAMLDAIYEAPSPCRDLIPRRQAAQWHGLALHHAASEYYSHHGSLDPAQRNLHDEDP